eukprot:gene14363-16949_t
MLKSPQFWDDEFMQPLLKMDRGFIKEQGVDKTLAKMSAEDIKDVDFGDDEPERIFLLDAERTYANEENKKKLARILTYLNKQFGDYQQGMSFVSSFLLLTLEENEAIALLIKINSMIPGFWKHEAVAFGTEAHTFYHILQKQFPNITAHLEKNIIDPGTFCQRWFLGLCVHLLPFKQLFQFFEMFLEGGREFLLRFGLAMFKTLESKVLGTTNPNTIFGLLRMDPLYVTGDELFQSIIDNCSTFDLSEFDLPAIRVQIFEEKLKERIEKAHKVHAEVESIDDCLWCMDNLPEFYCVQCKEFVCEDCLENPPDKHDVDSHKLLTLEEYEDQQDELKAAAKEEQLVVKLSDMAL